ncbi:MAG: SMI1/KNR4 family protein [Saccharofermentans sp.]|nr:SMI1/KNR4 family protein [Saccharofermentans sp.]
MILELIRSFYGDNIVLLDPCGSDLSGLPDVLKEILKKSDGIQESMVLPKTGERITIGWIIYSYEMIQKMTAYYKDEYGIEGTVFSDDGAGNPYYILDGKIYQFDPIDNESEQVAESLEEFYKK